MNKFSIIAGERVKTLDVPSKWDELSLSQMRQILANPTLSKFQLFRILINLAPTDILTLVLLKRLDQTEVWKIHALVDAFLKNPPFFTKNVLQKIRVGFAKIKTVKNFNELEFWKFAQADMVLMAAKDNLTSEALAQMIGYLYDCPPNLAARINKIDQEIILRWYLGNRLALVERYAQLFENGEAKSKYNFGWFGTLESISTGLSEMDLNGKQPVETIFYYLQMKILQAEEKK